MIEMLRRMYQSFRRPSTARTVTVWSLCAALIAVGLGAGAGSVSAQSSTENANQPVSTSFGETVVLTTDQKGAQTPFNIVLLNGQTSGTGDQEISLNMDNYGTKTWNINNGPGQVQNFLNVSGPFQGEVPLTIATSLKVNGEEVDPNAGYNLNGDVEITYTMENHTGRQQTISYKGIDGQTHTATADIPVPFGNSFVVNFGEGWYITDAGKMTASPRAGGTQLTATAILFPIIPGMVGGTTQTYTIKAHAENASLPGTTSTAVPQNLDAMLAQYTPEIMPIVQNDIVNPIETMFSDSIAEVLGAAGIISGYTGSFASLNRDFIDPLIRDITSIKVNPILLEQRLGRLEGGLRGLAELLLANEVAADEVVGLLVEVSRVLGTDAVKIVNWFATFIEDLAPTASAAADAIEQITIDMLGVDTAAITTYATPGGPFEQWCNAVGNTSEYYGNTIKLPIPITSPGIGALNSAINSSSGQQKAALQQLQVLLGKPPTLFGVPTGPATTGQSPLTLPPTYAFLAASQYPGLIKSAIQSELVKQGLTPAQAAPLAQMLTTMLGSAGCKNTLALLEADSGAITQVLELWDKYKSDMPALIIGLRLLAAAGESPLFKALIDEIMKDLVWAAKKVNNPSCTNDDILRDIEAAIKKYGINGISANIEAIMLGILQDCGLAQLVNFLGTIDGLVGRASGDLATLVGNIKSDTPKIANGVRKVTDIAALGGKVFDSIPTEGQAVGNLIAGFAGKAEVAGKTLEEKIGNYIAQLLATVHAMSQRTTNGDGAPYGKAQGENVTTAATYQITQQPAQPYGANYTWAFVVAAIFLLIALGFGTFLYRRRRRPLAKFIDGGTP